MRIGAFGKIDQQKIVAAISLVMAVAFSIFLPGFANFGNLITLLQNVSIIGVLGIAMAVVIIGRGIDLAMVAVFVMPVAWMFQQVDQGMAPTVAVLLALAMSFLIGLFNGWLTAYMEIPPILATMASGILIYGGVQASGVAADVTAVPAALGGIQSLFQGFTLGIPNVIIFFAVNAGLVWLFLRFTSPGRYIYAIGDNPLTANVTGLPVRQIILLQYAISALMAFIAGVASAATVNSVNTRIFNSTLLYDVILVVVLGGIGLSGGKGSISNVIVGTIMIAILVNGMTLMDMSFFVQNILRATILLVAIVIDSIANPRDEQTSQLGDI
jgi:ribose transport system permease protein